MEPLNEYQNKIVDYIKKHPDCKIGDIATSINVPYKFAQSQMDHLEGKGVYLGEDDGCFILVMDKRKIGEKKCVRS